MTCLATTLDGSFLVSGSSDKNLKFWNLNKKFGTACIKTLSGHSDGIWGVAISQDNQKVVSASIDKTLRVWNIESGLCLRVMTGHFN